MSDQNECVRVLYSFPLRLGAERICTTAWYQIDSLAAAGAEVLVFPCLHWPAGRAGREGYPDAGKREVAPPLYASWEPYAAALCTIVLWPGASRNSWERSISSMRGR